MISNIKSFFWLRGGMTIIKYCALICQAPRKYAQNRYFQPIKVIVKIVRRGIYLHKNIFAYF